MKTNKCYRRVKNLRKGMVEKANFHFSSLYETVFNAVGLRTLQFLEKERLSAAPLSVQSNTDRWLHGGLAKDVC